MATSTTDNDPPKPLLPADLAKALTWLSASELETLLGAVKDERNRRTAAVKDNAPAVAIPQSSRDPVKPKIGQVNAIRAALKAGIKPSTVAKQFGVSRAIVANVAADHALDR